MTVASTSGRLIFPCTSIRPLLILSVMCSLLSPRLSYACSCAPPSDSLLDSVESALEQADIVFVGEAENSELSDDDTVQITTFYVRNSWKGTIANRVITKVVVSCCVCGYHFDVGSTYLVFGYERKDNFYSASICSLTRNLEHATEIIHILERLRAER